MNNIQDEFISTVSHEMRTPLTSIRGFSQTLLNSWDKIDEENKKKFVKIIEEQSNRLINLVENVLTVSKINADKPVFRAVDVNSSIEKVLQMFSQKYKDYKICRSFNNHLPLVRLDEEKFQQVMTNLIDNACKYSDSKKEIEITTSFLNSDYVKISVKDYGVGIKEEDFGKVFDKFIRLENHLTSITRARYLGFYFSNDFPDS